MGMVMRNHESLDSGAYHYGFASEVSAWREVAEDRDRDVSAYISIETLELFEELDPSVNLAGEPVMEDILCSFLGLYLSFYPNHLVRFLPVIPTVGAVQTLSVFSTGSNRRSLDRWCKGAIPALRFLKGDVEKATSNSAPSAASPLAAQQIFRSEDL
ncbi:hypothetical protein AYI68_g2750 [Smittium mucronatum]|uniref:Uncharacterized protein n=1 Tax=Smittium mucronatum TaxID=133383 RepID=A0A1R0H1V9_9FUNG|nr:hypothetical protein AYI68_g2750 [Smittium mucronatum]